MNSHWSGYNVILMLLSSNSSFIKHTESSMPERARSAAQHNIPQPREYWLFIHMEPNQNMKWVIFPFLILGN